MSDLISRQAAIDELIAMREHIDARMSVIGCTAYEMAIEALREPEIIRCKDCKHWDELLAMCKKSRRVIFGVKDFCSKAERRTDETD